MIQVSATPCTHGVLDAVCVRCLVAHLQFPMLQHQEEIIPFCEWLMTDVRPKNILEIGTGPGGLTELFGSIATGRVITIDLPTKLGTLRNVYLRGVNQRFVGVQSNSHYAGTMLHVGAVLGEGLCDLLFIDGDHSYQGVQQDAVTYRAFVRKGGWVAFHDINSDKFNSDDMAVPQFWRELKGEKREWSIGHEWGGIGAIRV